MSYTLYLLVAFIYIGLNTQQLFGEVHIFNGETAVEGQFPYQVGIRIFRSYGVFWCGGVLISNFWVLTAAHCMKGAIATAVYLGDTKRGLAKVNFYVPGQNILLHAKFNANNMQNDIAVIKLPERVPFSDNIKPANLPTINQTYDTNENLIVSGWGDLGDNAGSARELQFAQILIVDRSICLQYFGSYFFNENNFCTADSTYKSACRGDSGGPAVLKDTSTLIGLVSFGSSLGCSKGYPVAFTKVSLYRNWIELVTGTKYD